MLYFAFVYPHLLYGIEIYGNTCKSHISKLEILNNKILPILQNRSIRTLYKSYDTLSLSRLEHSNSQFESIHRFIVSESIRIDSFCEKIGLSIHQFSCSFPCLFIAVSAKSHLQHYSVINITNTQQGKSITTVNIAITNQTGIKLNTVSE